MTQHTQHQQPLPVTPFEVRATLYSPSKANHQHCRRQLAQAVKYQWGKLAESYLHNGNVKPPKQCNDQHLPVKCNTPLRLDRRPSFHSTTSPHPHQYTDLPLGQESHNHCQGQQGDAGKLRFTRDELFLQEGFYQDILQRGETNLLQFVVHAGNGLVHLDQVTQVNGCGDDDQVARRGPNGSF